MCLILGSYYARDIDSLLLLFPMFLSSSMFLLLLPLFSTLAFHYLHRSSGCGLRIDLDEYPFRMNPLYELKSIGNALTVLNKFLHLFFFSHPSILLLMNFSTTAAIR